ncbi:hypothetical protein D1872_231010 [compost metagenome]
MLKKQWGYSKLLSGKVTKYLLSLIGTVIIPHSGMVTTNNEMSAAIIFAYHCMEYSLSWPRITHRSWKYAQKCTIRRIIMLQ